MALNDVNSSLAAPAAVSAADSARVASFLRTVYAWMFAGLAITALVAWQVAASPSLVSTVIGNRGIFWALMIVQLGIVLFLSVRIDKLAPTVASLLFIGYSALTGVTFAVILLAFTGQSIASIFLVTAGMFGALALYGTLTRRNLSGVGQFAMMGLVGVVLASVVGIFWHNDMLQFVISVCGVVVFTGLTAWDSQKLRAMALVLPDGRIASYAILGALTLYLDFINLFLMLLRLFGRRR